MSKSLKQCQIYAEYDYDQSATVQTTVNTLRPMQGAHIFAPDVFQVVFLNKTLLRFAPDDLAN